MHVPSGKWYDSLHSPLPALSAPLTLKEYTTPVCSVNTMYCDVVFMFVMLLVLVLVTSTWYTTTHWLSRDQVRLTDDSMFTVPTTSVVVNFRLLGVTGITREREMKWNVKAIFPFKCKYLSLARYQHVD